MDNRIFNVNGTGKDELGRILFAAFAQCSSCALAAAYRVTPKHGLILYQYHTDDKRESGKEFIRFPAKLGAEAALSVVWQWLESGPVPSKELSHWDLDADHDGSNSIGWRVYCEDWGHVDNDWGAICAITPAFMWHGK